MIRQPTYRDLYQSGELVSKTATALNFLSACNLCPRRCGVDRSSEILGYCRAGARATVSTAGAHFGEEAPLVGLKGSGTIFFAFCNLGCVFCQNYSLSQGHEGTEVNAEALAELMIGLQQSGCHNINLVTPTHVMPQILEGLTNAVAKGLRIPLVYKCGGYESLTAIQHLENIVDIYMPDVKFFDVAAATSYANAPNYPSVIREVLYEMQRQVGFLELDEGGLAKRGLLIRHLIMPGMIDDSIDILDFIARELGRNSYVNVMAQYRPLLDAHLYPEIARKITQTEYRTVVEHARSLGLIRGLERRTWEDWL